jgi:photosystem II stability/assembly factor-like uncharacterized protein
MMLKRTISLLIILSVYGVSFAQRINAGNRKVGCPRSAKRSKAVRCRDLARSKGMAKNDGSNSVVGSLFFAVARDSSGGIWAGGSLLLSKGLLLRNTDGEISVRTFPEVQRVEDLAFPGTGVGWMIGGGHLYRTGDAGFTWQRVRIKTEPEFRSLSFSDAQRGWAAGWNGVIYHTEDGGSSWRKQHSATTLDLWKINFIDAAHGWATGGRTLDGLKWRPVLLATTDGGRTWKILSNDPDLTLHDVTFVDPSHGWGLDLRRKIIVHTNDGGETWIPQLELENSYSSIFFLNQEQGWLLGEAVLHTDDGGQTWDIKTADDFAYSLNKAIFIDTLHGWAIGKASDQTPNLLTTSDGGQTWTVISTGWRERITESRLPFTGNFSQLGEGKRPQREE